MVKYSGPTCGRNSFSRLTLKLRFPGAIQCIQKYLFFSQSINQQRTPVSSHEKLGCRRADRLPANSLLYQWQGPKNCCETLQAMPKGLTPMAKSAELKTMLTTGKARMVKLLAAHQRQSPEITVLENANRKTRKTAGMTCDDPMM